MNNLKITVFFGPSFFSQIWLLWQKLMNFLKSLIISE